MKGLIKKDLLLIKGNIKLVSIMLIAFIVASIASSNETMDLSLILQVIVFVSFLSTFSYDEYNKWDAYAISLPNGRKNIVKSKYLAVIILSIIALVIGVLINGVIAYTKGSLDIMETICESLGVFASLLFINSIMYPFIFKFGIEKGRLGIFVLSFGIAGLVMLLQKYIPLSSIKGLINFLKNTWYYIVPCILVLSLFISYKISERIYSKKEF